MAIVDTNGTTRVLALGAPAGPPGLSAYQHWLSLGNAGSLADYLASLKGTDGTNGAKGADGAGAVVTRIATMRILPSSAVVPSGDFGAAPANPANPDHLGQVVGITALGAEAGAIVTFQAGGDLDGVSGNFAAGDLLFPSTNGTLTRVVPTTGWRQSVGRASSSTRIAVALSLAYALPDAIIDLSTPSPDALKASLALDKVENFSRAQMAAAGPIADGINARAPLSGADFVGPISAPVIEFSDQVFMSATYDPVSMDARVDINRQSASRNTTFSDVFMTKDTRGKPLGPSTGVSSMLKIEQSVGAADCSQWPFVSTVHLYGGGQGQHVAVTPQAIKHEEAGQDAANLWAAVCELRDYTANPKGASVSIESGLHVAGPDPYAVRRSIDVSLGESFDPGVKANCASDAGVSVGNTSGFHNHRTRHGFRMSALWGDAAYSAQSREDLGASTGAYRRFASYRTQCAPNVIETVIQARKFASESGQRSVASEMVHIADGAETNRMSLFSDHTEFAQPVSLQLPSYLKATLPDPGLFTARPVYVSDGPGGKRLAISAGTAWVYPDGSNV